MLSEWQVYRMFDGPRPWTTFQFLVRERLTEVGAEVTPDGRVKGASGARRERARPGARGRRGARAEP